MKEVCGGKLRKGRNKEDKMWGNVAKKKRKKKEIKKETKKKKKGVVLVRRQKISLPHMYTLTQSKN